MRSCLVHHGLPFHQVQTQTLLCVRPPDTGVMGW
jgi:hypothetical protein